jgi:hypothetical protein
MTMDRDAMIAALKSIEEEAAWYDDDEGLEIYILSSQGLYDGGAQYGNPIDGPFVLEEEDLNQYQVDMGDDIDDLDFEGEDVLEMIQSGCQPGMNYYKWGQEFHEDDEFHEWEEIVEDLAAKLIEDSTPTPWDDMDDGELAKWIGVRKLIGDGYLGWGELSESDKHDFLEG